MQELKITDESAGLETAELEDGGLEFAGLENAGSEFGGLAVRVLVRKTNVKENNCHTILSFITFTVDRKYRTRYVKMHAAVKPPLTGV